MKKILFLVPLLAILCLSLKRPVSITRTNPVKEGPARGIDFVESSWTKALELAGKENKPIFLDAYASWCGPCQLMKRTTFTNPNVASFYNRNFINVAIDMEKGEGPALLNRYSVTVYPTLIITDKQGNLIRSSEGFQNPGELISLGKKALRKMRKTH